VYFLHSPALSLPFSPWLTLSLCVSFRGIAAVFRDRSDKLATAAGLLTPYVNTLVAYEGGGSDAPDPGDAMSHGKSWKSS